MAENSPYMPSNGTEGMSFTETWCDRCSRRALSPDAKTQCVHELKAPAGDQHNLKWYYIDGVPTCTAFRDRKRARARKKKVDKNQLSLFPGPQEGECRSVALSDLR